MWPSSRLAVASTWQWVSLATFRASSRTLAIYSWNGYRSPVFSAGTWAGGLTWKCQLILTLVPPAGQDPAYAEGAPLVSQDLLADLFLHLWVTWYHSGGPLQLVHLIVQCSNFLLVGIVAHELDSRSPCSCASLGHRLLVALADCTVIFQWFLCGQTSIVGCMGSGVHQIPTSGIHLKTGQQLGISLTLLQKCQFLGPTSSWWLTSPVGFCTADQIMCCN